MTPNSSDFPAFPFDPYEPDKYYKAVGMSIFKSGEIVIVVDICIRDGMEVPVHRPAKIVSIASSSRHGNTYNVDAHDPGNPPRSTLYFPDEVFPLNTQNLSVVLAQ